jgi:hypothetical protein
MARRRLPRETHRENSLHGRRRGGPAGTVDIVVREALAQRERLLEEQG